MKNASKLFVVALIALMGLTSCFDLISLLLNDNDDPEIGETRNFWAQNFKTESHYQVRAELLYIGSKCKIWVEKGSGVGADTAKDMANTYDNVVYPRMMDAFGSRNGLSFNGKVVASDTMEFSSWLVDGDGKLTILLLDIKDGYTPSSGAYTAGYFWAVNHFENIPSHTVYRYSNFCDMIYIDIDPGRAGSKTSNMTLAHEMQHLMNFVTSIAKRATYTNGELTALSLMETWVDEGLSAAAEYVYAGEHNMGRIQWFNGDDEPNERLIGGDNFYVWGNYVDSDPNSILNDYATVYLFFQWLRLQSGDGSAIYKDIIESASPDYRAVLGAAKNRISAEYASNWGLLLRDWMAANYINAANGTYGYMNDPALKDVQAMVAEGFSSSHHYPLAPGEGIYTQRTTTSGVTASPKIKLAGLHKSPEQVSDNQAAPGGVLLSYNVDTDTRGDSSYCYPFPSVEIAGAGPGKNAALSLSRISQGDGGAARGLYQQPQLPGPYPIGAGDMLRLNGHSEGLAGLDFARLRGRIEAGE